MRLVAVSMVRNEGDIIEAAGAPVRFGHEGALSWTLEPGSRVQVRAMGKAGVGHVVALERGSLRAEVTPRDASEGMVEAFARHVNLRPSMIAVVGDITSRRATELATCVPKSRATRCRQASMPAALPAEVINWPEST